MKYFDAHCHIQFPPYDEDRETLIGKMRTEEVGGLVVGVDADSSRKAIALAQAHPGTLLASVGLHPNDTPEEEFDVELFTRLGKEKEVVAIGECGIDFYRLDPKLSPVDVEREKIRQRDVFQKHIDIAAALGKPLMIHARPSKGTQDAYQEVIGMLKSAEETHGEKTRGNIHFFVGGIEEALAFVSLGFTCSFTAVLTFTGDYDEVIRTLPLSSILSETDAPYVAPASRRGSRNDSFAARDVVAAIARIRGEDEEEVRLAILENARHQFAF